MDTQLLPYRLKSARRKKRLLKEDRDKQLRRMDKEYNRLQEINKKLPCVPLEEPYQKGWKRLYVLRPEVANSENAEFYQNILDEITEVQYHYDQSFKRRKKRWLRCDHERLPRLRVIDKYRWASGWHELTDEQRLLFKKVVCWNETHYQWDHYYEFTEPWLFEIAVQPHIVTEVKLLDEGLEREIAFIDNKIYESDRQYRLQKLKGGYYKYWRSWYYVEKEKYINPLKNKPKWRWSEE